MTYVKSSRSGSANSCSGPAYGYFVNRVKTWLVVKKSVARDLFSGTNISITIKGRPNLGSPVGSQSYMYMEDFIRSKVDAWTTSLKTLSQIALSNPHAAYAAPTHGLSNLWLFIM